MDDDAEIIEKENSTRVKLSCGHGMNSYPINFLNPQESWTHEPFLFSYQLS